ncbi:pentapeptide repeat-containing protein [Gimesia sp.]|uniref:pentapeptide repeat-containing protein n=1 Tax=Gimesia sp. TaxID=2024833 RepID=UPI003A8CEA02
MTIRFKLLTLLLLLLSIVIPVLDRNTDWLERISDTMQEIAEPELFAAAFLGLVIWPLRQDFIKFTQWMHHLAVRYLEAMGDHIWVAVGIAFGILLIQVSPEKSDQLPLQPNLMQKLSGPKIQPENQIHFDPAPQIKELHQDLYRAGLLNILYQDSSPVNRPDSEVLLRLMDVKPPKATKALRQVAVMEFIQLEQAAGKTVDLSGAFLNELDLSQKNLHAHGVKGALQDANFSSASLYKADFTDTNLRGADFSRARLIQTRFSGTILIDANLEAANLQGASFSGARLSGARLHRTYLIQTFFKGACLNGALVNSINWIHDYNGLNPEYKTFVIKWHSVVEQQDKNGNPMFVITGIDPPVEARKPDQERD